MEKTYKDMKKLSILTLGLLFSIFILSTVSAVQTCKIYDDFSSGSLNASKWEIRQDTEGQPLMEEYDVILENSSYVFHTKNTANDRRVYLFPNRTFTTGDIFEYDSILMSREGTYAQMTLITGSQYYRL